MVTIEILVKKDDTTKKKGDLLEDLSEKFLEAQNYYVSKEVRKVGAELDLLCSNRANSNKEIYVECKAYKKSNKIQADVIKNIVGIQAIEGYEEVWLITTTELGKDAKGLVDKLIKEQRRRDIVIYTPAKLIEALVRTQTICSYKVIEAHIKKEIIFDHKTSLGDKSLVITQSGYYYFTVVKVSGEDSAVLVHHAQSGESVYDHALLGKLKELESSYEALDFFFIEKRTKSEVKKEILYIEEIKLDNSYLNRLNDISIKISHPLKNNLKLYDIFVFQDLEYIQEYSKEKISSEVLLDIEHYSKSIVFGEEVSGKSSLMATLQQRFNQKSLIPISFEASELKSSDYDKFLSKLLRNFRKQYAVHKHFSLDELLQYQDKIVVLIDNFEKLTIGRFESRVKFIQMLNEHFDKLYIFSHNSLQMELMTKEAFKRNLEGFNFFKIKEYGHRLRDKVVEKWLTLGQEETIEENTLLERKFEVCKMIETVIGNKFMPTYPLYIITLIKKIESGTSNNLGGSAYAEFYNYLINQAMGSTNIKADELDFYHTYLSFIAYHYFVEARKELDEDELKALHDEYSRQYHKKSFSGVYDNLLRAKIIKREAGFYSFSHKYIYYFYVAKYLSDNMEKRRNRDEVQEIIDSLVKRLYRVEFANIVLFLIHHSKTRAESIIEKIVGEAKSIFEDVSPATLSSDELFKINELVTEEIKTVIEEKNPHEYRENSLDERDRKEEMIEQEEAKQHRNILIPKYDEDVQELDVFGKVNLSIKLMEILGQISKNYYGSLLQEEKDEIIGELSKLGLRNLNWFLKQFSEYQNLLEQEIFDLIDKENIRSAQEKEQVARRIIFNFAELISRIFLQKISNSVASKNLFDSIDKLAKDSEAMRLVAISTKLDFSHGLNIEKISNLNKEFSKNIIAQELLKYFVINHLYKFEVPYKKKQEVCDKLNIGMQIQKQILAKKAK